MSGPPDNFLARWSRRKREVGEGAERNMDGPSPARGDSATRPGLGEEFSGVELPPNEPLPSPSAQGGEQAQPAAPLKPLPRLEELTAESDLSAFMRAGVPEGLKKAALRRMWSLDPAIRDHVGLAEYAWDFNNPGSMAGFGAVAAGTPMAQLAASVMSGQGDRSGLSEGAPETPEAPPPRVEPCSSEESDHLPTAVAPDESHQGPHDPSGIRSAQAPRTELPHSAALPQDKADPVAELAVRETPAPRHGRAMPR